MTPKKRKELITKALRELDGEATIRQIAQRLNFNVNGVSQTLGVMRNVQYVDGRSGNARWRFKTENSSDKSQLSFLD